MEREHVHYYYPPAVTKKILGLGLSIYTIGISWQKALGNSPFSVVHAEGSAAYWIALAYAILGVLLGTGSAVYSLATSRLKLTGWLAVYVLTYVPATFINASISVPMQFASAISVIGVAVAAASAKLRSRREEP